MTLDEFIRYIALPALGAAAAVGLFISIRETIRDYRRGEW